MSFLNKINSQDKFIATFILKAIGLYLIWFILYENWLVKDGLVDHILISHLTNVTEWLLNLLGYVTFKYHDAVGIDGTHGVLIGVPCNGFDLFALFTGFIIAFPGKIKYKLIFIPIGLLIIHVLNILRLFGLALIVLYYPDSLDFNHKYTFTIFVYAIIFLMWVYWVRKYSLLSK